MSSLPQIRHGKGKSKKKILFDSVVCCRGKVRPIGRQIGNVLVVISTNGHGRSGFIDSAKSLLDDQIRLRSRLLLAEHFVGDNFKIVNAIPRKGMRHKAACKECGCGALKKCPLCRAAILAKIEK